MPIAAVPNPPAWLNGWPLLENHRHVLMGCVVHCAGCGAVQGVTNVIFEENWKAPEKQPDWPFPDPPCPICSDQ